MVIGTDWIYSCKSNCHAITVTTAPVVKHVTIYYIDLCNVNQKFYVINSLCDNRIGGIMVSMLVSSAVDRGFNPRSGQIKDYNISICCFTAKHAAIRSNRKRLVGLESE